MDRLDTLTALSSSFSEQLLLHPRCVKEGEACSLTTHQVRNALKKNRARKAAGPDGISSMILKSCTDQLCGIFGYTFNLSLKLGRVATALEDVLHCPSAKDTAPQSSSTATGRFAYQPDIRVDDAVIYLLHTSLTHLEKAGSTVRIMFFDFSSAFNTIQPRLLRTYSGLCGLVPAEQPPDQRLVKPRSWWWISAGVATLRLHLVSIQGTDIDTVKSYRYLGVHLNDSLDWTHNTDALVKKGNSRLFLLRRSFGVQGPLLRTFYDSVVASAIFYGIVCWVSSITDKDRRRMDRLVRRASSVLGGKWEDDG
ncbi:hypothetical protein L3Q82_024371 [Scortum barcoo]|uniref:Uncharacterized protein n=1 Tax=Scortum barcoo TaxID=214431 RepID=A0ACB8WVM0_9TELE|nr:hypothetical protein L3Q82_024371 [Scortum barcoo]